MGAPTLTASTHRPSTDQVRDASARLRSLGINPLDAMGMRDPAAGADDGIYARERLDQEPTEAQREANPDAETMTAEERIARLIDFAATLGRKAEVADISRQTVRDAATWLRRYTGSFDFLNDVKGKGGVKTAGQAKGVVNCVRADLARGGNGQPAQAPQTAPEAAPAAQAPATREGRPNRYAGTCEDCGAPVSEGAGITVKNALTGKWGVFHGAEPGMACPARTAADQDLPYYRQDAPGAAPLADVPSGHFAIESTGDNDLAFYRVDRPTEGAYSGRVFVKMIVGGHPDMNVRQAAVAGILARIAEAGVQESATLYGRSIGRCCRCNRTLTDETSRANGIGPECATKGW